MANNANNIIIAIVIFIIIFYVLTSLTEWCLHYFVMHKHGFKLFNIKSQKEKDDTHLEHHIKTHLTQNNTGPEKGIVFDIFSLHVVLLTSLLLIIYSICWLIIPQLQSCISYKIYTTIILFSSLFYYWCWGSIHSTYHNRKIKVSDQISYNLIPYFTPDVNSSIYKYLFTYHSLHHLNKGESKGNYNIICPLFDHIFQTYKSKVDNRLHFSKNKPKTQQEEWLSKNQMFDVCAFDNNQLRYKLENSNEWLPFPDGM